jgi:hypothetical protein
MESNGSGKRESGEVSNLVKTILNERWHMAIGRLFHGILYGLGMWWRSLFQSVRGEASIDKRGCGDNNDVVDQNCLERDFLSKKKFCQDLEKRGLLGVLSLGEPEEIGFTFDWYRYSTVSQS